MGTFVVHQVANVETVLWTDEAPRPREKGNAENPGRRAQKRDNNFHSITKTILPGYWVVLAPGVKPNSPSSRDRKKGPQSPDPCLPHPTPAPQLRCSPCVFGFLEIQQPGQSEHHRGSISTRPGAGTRERRQPLQEAQQVGRASDPRAAPRPLADRIGCLQSP